MKLHEALDRVKDLHFYSSFTLRDWEFGIGFYFGSWHGIQFIPSEFTLMFGPFSVGFTNHVEVSE